MGKDKKIIKKINNNMIINQTLMNHIESKMQFNIIEVLSLNFFPENNFVL